MSMCIYAGGIPLISLPTFFRPPPGMETNTDWKANGQILPQAIRFHEAPACLGLQKK